MEDFGVISKLFLSFFKDDERQPDFISPPHISRLVIRSLPAKSSSQPFSLKLSFCRQLGIKTPQPTMLHTTPIVLFMGANMSLFFVFFLPLQVWLQLSPLKVVHRENKQNIHGKLYKWTAQQYWKDNECQEPSGDVFTCLSHITDKVYWGLDLDSSLMYWEEKHFLVKKKKKKATYCVSCKFQIYNWIKYMNQSISIYFYRPVKQPKGDQSASVTTSGG